MRNSRPAKKGFAVRRRRECSHCGTKFNTLEKIEELEKTVVNREGRRQPYRRERLKQDLQPALLNSSISSIEAEALLTCVEQRAFALDEPEISTGELTGIVLSVLKDFEEQACLRYFSLYRNFDNVDDFRDKFQDLMEEEEGGE